MARRPTGCAVPCNTASTGSPTLADLFTDASPPVSCACGGHVRPRPVLLIAAGNPADDSVQDFIRRASRQRRGVGRFRRRPHGRAQPPVAWENRVTSFLDMRSTARSAARGETRRRSRHVTSQASSAPPSKTRRRSRSANRLQHDSWLCARGPRHVGATTSPIATGCGAAPITVSR